MALDDPSDRDLLFDGDAPEPGDAVVHLEHGPARHAAARWCRSRARTTA